MTPSLKDLMNHYLGDDPKPCNESVTCAKEIALNVMDGLNLENAQNLEFAPELCAR